MYKILGYQTTSLLSDMVMYYIKQGWIPIGGVSVIIDSDDNESYYQAIYKPTQG